MAFQNNFSIFNLFLDKKVTIYTDDIKFDVQVPTIKDLMKNNIVGTTYSLITSSAKKIQKLIPIKVENSFELIHNIFFVFGMYKEFNIIFKQLVEGVKFFIPNINIDFKNKELKIDNTTITLEIWNYIIYILKLSCGEKISEPRIFSSEEERLFYLAQEEMEEKINRIKSNSNKKDSNEALLKTFLTIRYKFGFSFEYLFEQTLAQIQWLQKYAAGAVSYEVNAQAFAAGNMKKGKSLDFFIK